MSYSLVIVDMQNYFSASREARVRTYCSKEILKAKYHGYPIIFAEYRHYGKTTATLLNLVKNYSKVYRTIKSKNDGSRGIVQLIHKHNFSSFQRKNFRICGVNTDFCVHDTVLGMRMRLPDANIIVPISACNSNWSHQEGIKKIRKIKNIILE